MANDRVANLEANIAFWASIEPAARKQLAEDLGQIGLDILEAQQAAAPVRTGRLRDALTVAQALNNLRVRVGYPDMKRKDDRFYAIMQEYGVKAGEKMVQRRKRVKGRLRLQRGKKRTEDVVSTYRLRWPARPARPFVHLESRFDQVLQGVQDRFWDSVLAKAGD
ncbi:MAG TPA: HK97 gp10 family phage protein [Novosphingobium sp.]|nr:HK97 gp10 family phage protein [Novosphingobium sp.]